MTVSRLDEPPASAFLGDLRAFYHWDSYEAPLTHGDLAMHEIYPALFAHHPRWSDTEIVTGGDDRHLDFRVSVQRMGERGTSRVVLSTVVSPHNLFGRMYLAAILPFHRLGVRTILSNAIAAGRL